MAAHAMSCNHSRRITSLVPFSSMSNIRQWLGGTPQTMTGSRPGPQAAPGQPMRPRSASCPASFPHVRTPYIVSEHSPDESRSTGSPTSHASEDGSPAAESDTTYVLSSTDALSLMPQFPWHPWLSSPPSSDDSDDPDDPDDPDDSNDSNPIPPAYLPEFTGRGDYDHVYRDFRSLRRAWQRDRNEKKKYDGFWYFNRAEVWLARDLAKPAPPPSATNSLSLHFPRLWANKRNL